VCRYFYESIGDGHGAALALNCVVKGLRTTGRLDEAREKSLSALEALRSYGDQSGAVNCLNQLGLIASAQGEIAEGASGSHRRSRSIRRSGTNSGLPRCWSISRNSNSLTDKSAAKLLGYVETRFKQLGYSREPTDRWVYERLPTSLREQLSESEIERLVPEGAAWSEGQAADEATTN
jgi:hypothetical protein